MPNKTAIMTAIPYVNSTPHIGNVLTTLSGDISARYLRMRGEDVFFQSGTDENGLKIKEAAEKAGENVHAFVDRIAQRFIDIFAELGIQYDAFVRTTEPRHAAASRALFKKLQENGHIYVGTYEGWYDVSTETFFKEDELVDGKSPDGNEVRWVSEQNYFFRLSAFQQPLLDAYATGRIRVVPETRQNEVLSFIRQGLRDICVSRSNPGWGITVPGDDAQVIYVWFDALINYLTSTGWPDAPDWEDKWPPLVQWLGKDILTRFHATLWPAMLMGIGVEIPKIVAAHAWILLGKEKISKSRGNVVEPIPLVEELCSRAGFDKSIGVDSLRWYMASTMGFENDSTYTDEEFDRRYNSDLANDLGNALNRTLSMAHKFVDGAVPAGEIEPDVAEAILQSKAGFEAAMADFRIDRAAESAISLVRYLNKYTDTRAPWSLAKSGSAELAGVMRSLLLGLRSAEGLVRPIMPKAADSIAFQLQLPPSTDWNAIGSEASLPAGHRVGLPQPIFPRLEVKKPVQETKQESTAPAPSPAAVPSEITIDDFAKIQLRIGRVFEAEPLEGSDRLLKLQVVIGEEKRQIVAGIRASYSPEDLIGRQVVVVYNLKTAKLRGADSQGMLLAATDADGKAILLQPEREAPEGAGVK